MLGMNKGQDELIMSSFASGKSTKMYSAMTTYAKTYTINYRVSRAPYLAD